MPFNLPQFTSPRTLTRLSRHTRRKNRSLLLLHYSHFDPSDQVAHGGVLRTRQITQLLRSVNLTNNYLFYNSRIRNSLFNPIVTLSAIILSVFLFNTKLLKRAALNPLNVLYSAASLSKLSLFLLLRFYPISKSSRRIVFWESNVHYNYSSLLLFKKLGFKIVALPHNIESLVNDKLDHYLLCDSAGSQFESETFYLSLCDYILPISHLDCHNLSSLNTPVCCLPYIPQHDPCSLNYSVYKSRSSDTILNPPIIVVPSTCDNPPSFRAAQELIHHISSSRSLESYTFHFCGKGSQRLQLPSTASNVVLTGYLQNRQYEDLLCSCTSILIYSRSLTGLLTRVTELESTGIPLIVNSDASVQHPSSPCLFTYSSLEDISSLLAQISTNPLVDVSSFSYADAREQACSVLSTALSALTL